MSTYHTPVLLKEALDYLSIQKSHWYIDATLGGGGHTEEILKKGGKVIAIDQDKESIEEVTNALNTYIKSGDLILINDSFTSLEKIITDSLTHRLAEITGILFDLGVSSHQLDTPQRGFSFNKDTPLDMRMNPDFGATAADLINGLHEGELTELFEKLGEERFAKRIAGKIVEERKIKPINSTQQLADLIKHSVPKSNDKIHPATRVFQALRIAVNDELNALKQALPQALELLSPGGRLVVISFHSLEDRIVKNFFKESENSGKAKILTVKPIMATLDEQYDNPRARSAKLRTLEIK